ncbi:MAG: type II secretion system F family protein [Geminicoccaceae bacterium]
MPQFAYRALTEAGERVAGEIEAGDRRGAIQRLQAQGLIPIEAQPAGRGTLPGAEAPVGRPARSSGRQAAQVTVTTRELATLIGAGETLESALALVAGELGDRRLRAVFEGILNRVRTGASLSDAMAAEPRVFSRLYVGMVRAAEATGRLGEVLGELADLRERQEALRRQLGSALIYPAVLTLTAIGAVLVLLLYVVPQFTPVFAGHEDRLPPLTRFILDAAGWLRAHGQAMAVALACLGLLWLLAAQVGWLRLVGHRLALRVWGIGTLARERATAEVCRGLATLLKGGLDLPSALLLMREMVSNLAIAEALGRAASAVRQGRRLSEALAAEGILQPMGQKLLRTAEESGRLEPLARYIAERFEQIMATRMQRFATLLEPLLVIGLGGIVGGIVIAILTAVLSVNELAF